MILHYAGAWLFIDSEAPDLNRCYSITPTEWFILREMNTAAAKITLIIKKKSHGNITRGTSKNEQYLIR